MHKGLGEMQNLAVGVGDLKKVLSNVKNRGVLGEYQLENILEQLLTNEQFSKNVKTKHDSQTLVEFAVKLPGRDDKKPLWLPIDAKFPTEHYIALTEAYEQGDLNAVNEKRKLLAHSIRSCAKDISEKYIDPPNTTDFGIMFLPFEGLYAEVLRIEGLFEVFSSAFHLYRCLYRCYTDVIPMFTFSRLTFQIPERLAPSLVNTPFCFKTAITLPYSAEKCRSSRQALPP